MKEVLIKVGYDTMLITLNEGRGTITSSFSDDCNGDLELKAMLDAIESLVLAHACAGVDVQSEPYLQGLETAVEAIFNNA
jgi:hypothetical protein